MKIMLNLFLKCSLSLILITGINGVIIGDCGSDLGQFTSVTVTNCTDSMTTCNLKVGTNVSLSADFHTKANISKIVVKVYGIILGAEVPFPIPNPDGCLNSGLVCPLAADHNFTYTATLHVSRTYPHIAVTVKWVLLNEVSKPIICMLIPAKIV
uniref:Putative niemann-pick type c2 n=1 Tax=Panstrongylus lignarius TaxID=156445 RepID=A0A224XVJ4_9HEMI